MRSIIGRLSPMLNNSQPEISSLLNSFQTYAVSSLESIGAFLDWGFDKELFLPFSEQQGPLRRGQNVLVYVSLDKQNRPVASMKFDRFLMPATDNNLKTQQEVIAVIYAKTELGFKALVDMKYAGILYHNEVFKELPLGSSTKAFVRKVRSDGKVDLLLQATGHRSREPVAEEILSLLKKENGFLAITDKTEPERIYELFGVSKKKFKMALGALYKQRLITITDAGVRLTETAQ